MKAANRSIAERIALHPEKGCHGLLVPGLQETNVLPALSLGSVPPEIYNSDFEVPLWLVYP